MKALIVVDVQNDFLPGGSLGVPYGDEVIRPIVELIEDPAQKWDQIIMTRDWHPRNHTSFAEQHSLPDFALFTYVFEIDGEKKSQDATLWPVHCVQETYGSQLAAELVEEQKKIKCPIVDKGFLQDREYYSAFNDIWYQHRTELDSYLHAHDIDEVYVVGLALDFCVKNTAISASNLGYKTTILQNYTRAIFSDKKSVQNLRHELNENNVQLE